MGARVSIVMTPLAEPTQCRLAGCHESMYQTISCTHELPLRFFTRTPSHQWDETTSPDTSKQPQDGARGEARPAGEFPLQKSVIMENSICGTSKTMVKAGHVVSPRVLRTERLVP